MPELDERFADALQSAARSWRQAMDRRLKAMGLSYAGWIALNMAAKARPPLSQSELAERLGVEGATMVAMIDRLVKSGLVLRQSSQIDRRVNHIVVSEAGMRLAETASTEATSVRRDLLGPIDAKKLAFAAEVLDMLRARIAEDARRSAAATIKD